MKKLAFPAFALVALALVVGCASAPQQEPAPDWVLNAPMGDDDSEIFVVNGSSQTGDVAEAEETATLNLISEINRALGVEITAESNAEAISSAREFEATVRQQVRQTGEGRITGLRIADRYVLREDGRVTVWLLGEYDRASFLEEQRRREELVQQRIDAVAVPERRGRDAEQAGRYFEALGFYIEAAMAASTSEIANAEIYFEENINNARRVVSGFRLAKENDNLQGVVGRPFDEDFVASLTYEGGGAQRPVPNAGLVVSYPILRGNGRTGIENVSVSTDSEGIAEFSHPVPQLVGRETVTFSLDLSAYLRPLDDVGRRFRPYVDGLMDAVAATRARFEYETVSMAREIPTGVSVVDLTMDGDIRGTATAVGGLVNAMSSAGFRVRRVDVSPETLQSLDDSAVIAAAEGAAVERLAFGVFQVDEVVEDNGYRIRVSGVLRVVDLATGEVLYSDSKFNRAIGRNLESATTDAFRGLGEAFGEELVRGLR